MSYFRPLIGLALVAGCKGGGPVEPDPVDTSDCAVDSDCGAGRICEPVGTCVAGDRSNDFDEAVGLFQADGYEGEIEPQGDIDYFAYVSIGEEWLRVETTSDEEDVNTVITMFDPDKRVHAVMDDFPTGNINNFDSVLHVYLPTAGTWFVKVEDRGTFYPVDVEDGSGAYTLEIKPFTGTTDEIDAEDDPGASVDLEDGNTIFSVGVVVDEPGDVDWIDVGLPFERGPIEVHGQSDIPGSDAQSLVEIVDPEADGAIVARKKDVGAEGGMLFLDTKPQHYLLRVTDADAQGGPTYWYALYVRTRAADYYPYQFDAEPNDTVDASQLVDTVADQTSDGTGYDRVEFTGSLATESDEDWFTAEASAEDYVTVWCTSDAWGSLLDPAIDVYGPDGALLATGSDGDDDAPRLTNLAQLDQDGPVTFRVYNEGDEAAWGDGAYYGCSVFFTPFQATD